MPLQKVGSRLDSKGSQPKVTVNGRSTLGGSLMLEFSQPGGVALIGLGSPEVRALSGSIFLSDLPEAA